MKEDFDDIAFKQLLKENAHKPRENRWFTPRLMNRLPEKDSTTFSIEKWIYLIGVVLCSICWIVLFYTGFFDTMTVRTLIYVMAMAATSLFITFQAIRTAISA